ncbi:MAG TPA: M20/M25/M40 family metallo-hydrolase [Gemmatimonadaceae bacterium]|nr:M20/M25/M40 family metallo-hydrolase [Gemmatimonadaceae bacterium]
MSLINSSSSRTPARAVRAIIAVALSVALSACAGTARPSTDATGTTPYRATESSVRAALTALAADSMEGRGTATPGSARAARYIAAQFEAAGLEPAGDSGWFQRVPMTLQTMTRNGNTRTVPRLAESFAALDTVPADRRTSGVNVVGILAGTDPALAAEVVVIDAHYDHLGVRAPVDGDSIYNGADDDASGVVAVIEIARAMAAGPRPKRTTVFLATTGEEVGLLGTRWYLEHPVRPLSATVANLEIEMIGRPDSLAGGPGRAWLTGYERSTMGEELAAAGIPIGPDMRPDQNFFMRSDNIAFARLGIVAHTLSTFNLHKEYHTVKDDVSLVDFPHMTKVVNAAIDAARLLTDGPRPTWKPGGQPPPATRR